ncbi:MAG: two-component regulator propeller domain-containing protein [Flavisolibacter sp.]
MKLLCKYCILFLTLIFGLKQDCIAQSGNLRFEHIGIEEGLSGERVSAIMQDSKGYIWFGLQRG